LLDVILLSTFVYLSEAFILLGFLIHHQQIHINVNCFFYDFLFWW